MLILSCDYFLLYCASSMDHSSHIIILLVQSYCYSWLSRMFLDFSRSLIDLKMSDIEEMEGSVGTKTEEKVSLHDGVICIGNEILRWDFVSVCWLVAVVCVFSSGRHSIVRNTTFGLNFDKEHHQIYRRRRFYRRGGGRITCTTWISKNSIAIWSCVVAVCSLCWCNLVSRSRFMNFTPWMEIWGP